MPLISETLEEPQPLHRLAKSRIRKLAAMPEVEVLRTSCRINVPAPIRYVWVSRRTIQVVTGYGLPI